MPVSFLAILLSLIFTSSLSTWAESHRELVTLCRTRVKILDREFVKVLSINKYTIEARRNVKKAMSDVDLDDKSYKVKVESLKSRIDCEDREVNVMDCLLEAGDLVMKLDYIAEQGSRSLNDFSKSWKNMFSGQAKALGYAG